MKHSALWLRSVAPLALADLGELRRDFTSALAEVRRDFYANLGIGSLAGLGVAGGLAAAAERRAARKGESPR